MNACEWLCLWYLRLNGYFTLPNFYAHGRYGPLTEVDILGVRFPYSKEFPDDPALEIPKDGIDVVFAEAKTRQVESLNGPWSSPEKGALDYVLKRVGIAPLEEVAHLAKQLYAKRRVQTKGVTRITVRVNCFCESISKALLAEGVTFLPWNHVLEFVHGRFNGNDRLKADHEAWAEDAGVTAAVS
jgi:hypothetical protein